ncbi:MAG TPA: flagellar biosynthetic protein FliO [Kofleriaceae bacterium]|jgi:flagellar biogenesis protein FliO|nr:flagellar biosynthetic protein FliO [Kofleriaceae bacterium]
MRHAPVLAAVATLALAAAAHAEPAPVPSAAPAPPAAPAPAPPAPIDAPRFELLDRGDAVEVVAHHIKAARTAVLPIRSHLVVQIADAPQIKRVVPTDATVKLIELDRENSTSVLSIKLGFERNDVKALSRFAQAIQVGDDLHLLIPRKLPDGDVAPRLPDPTLPPAIAARVSAPAAPAPAITMPTPPAPPAPPPVLGPRAEPAPAAATAAPAPRPDDAARPRSAADALAAPAAAGATPVAHAPPSAPAGHPLTQALAPDRGDAWSQISMYAALGLAAAGAGVWLMRRRRTRTAPAASIDVIAQRALGGKARVVWLRAGQREMIVAVTAQQVRMLGQWRATESAAALPTAHTHADADLPRELPTPPLDKPLSPAVSGLLRLRGRTGQMAAVVPDLADTGDAADAIADAAWAREILAATGARR